MAVFTSFLVPLALAGVAAAALAFTGGTILTNTLITTGILFVVWLIMHFSLANNAICGCDENKKHRRKNTH